MTEEAIETTEAKIEAKIVSPNTDWDGMPLAPDTVTTHGIWSIFGPSLNQAKSWHVPTDSEKKMTFQMIQNWYLSTKNGISKETTKQILMSADAIGLQVFRVKQKKQKRELDDSIMDSFLMICTKPGIKNYSGAFFLLRETKCSKVIIIGPHDDSDGTFADTKIGLTDSFALACISNGHNRSHVGISGRRDNSSDFVHSTNNLGTYAVKQICELFKGYVVLHIHGMKNTQKCLYKCRDKQMASVFEKAISDNTRLDPADFKTFNAGFTIDPLVNTNFYLKTEIPTAIHKNNKKIIAKIAQAMETQPWCWESG